MNKIAILGDDRGLIRRTLKGCELEQIALPKTGLRNHPVDMALALCRPRAEWQAEYVRRQIERSGSRVVLTLTDNVEYLGYCSGPGSGSRTIAIQNGLRVPDTEWKYSIDRFRSMKNRGQFQHDVYVAWGTWDAERYLRLGGSARRMVVAGSLADALHRAESNRPLETHLIGALEMRNPRHLFYDLLLHPPRNPEVMAHYANNIRTLYSYLEKFCRTEKTQPLVILNSTHELSPQAHLLETLYSGPKRIHYDAFNTLASYDGASSCHVVVGVQSSLLVEVFGRGSKILAYNPSGSADLDFPIDGIWTLRDGRYQAFSERLRTIIEMSSSQWQNEMGAAPRELIAYDPHEPTDSVVRNLVDEIASE